MEGTHRKLGAGLAYRLSRDYPDRLADRYPLARRKVAAIARATDAVTQAAGQRTADLDGFYLSCVVQRFDVRRLVRVYLFVPLKQNAAAARVLHVLEAYPAREALGHRDRGPAVLLEQRADLDACVRAAVLFHDDQVLGDVYEAARQIAGFRGTEGRVGEPFSCSVRRNEVLQRIEAFLEVGDDRITDDAPRGVCHQPAYARHLGDLSAGAAGSGVDHYAQRVVHREAVHDLVGDAASGVRPEDVLLAHIFIFRQDAHLVLARQVFFLNERDAEYLLLLRRDYYIADAEADSADRRPAVAYGLYRVEHLDHARLSDSVVGVVEQLAHFLLIYKLVFIAEARMQRAVEEHAPRAGLDPLAVDRVAFPRRIFLKVYLGVDVDELVVERRKDVVHIAEAQPLALAALHHVRQVVDAEYDVLSGGDDGLSARGGEQVVR